MNDFLNCNCTFDKIKFPMFMHIKAPDENVLAQLIPEVWWDKKVPHFVYEVSVSNSGRHIDWKGDVLPRT